MPSSLSQSIFDLLQVYNGPWGLSATPPGVEGNVQGGANNDDLVITGLGGVAGNGNGGNDRITLGVGLLNIVNGGAGSDQIFGNAGINILNGNNGNDYIVGGGGADTLNGGPSASGGTAANPDVDTLSYESATGGGITLTLNANGGVNVGQFLPGRSNAGLDVIAGGFENVVGTNSADTITGNAEKNVLIGLAGDDTLNGGNGDDLLQGGAGADVLNGGAGFDTVDYSSSTGPVSINLNPSHGLLGGGGGSEGSDTYSGIEGVNGSQYADQFDLTEDNIAYGAGGADQFSVADFGATFTYKAFSDAPDSANDERITTDFRQRGFVAIDLSAVDPDEFPNNGNGDFTLGLDVYVDLVGHDLRVVTVDGHPAQEEDMRIEIVGDIDSYNFILML